MNRISRQLDPAQIVADGSKGYVRGTHRCCPPSETLGKNWPIAAQLGITRLANVTGLDYLGIPVFQCMRPNSKSLSVSQGKGLTADAARVSALMESIENWHAENVIRPLHRASFADMHARGLTFSPDAALPYTRSPSWRTDPLLWVEGYDLIGKRPLWVPLEMVDLDFSRLEQLPATFRKDGNGLASGNDRLEAISHALCEVIERDALALWELDASDPDGTRGLVDHATITDEDCIALIRTIERAGLKVGVIDITSDIGIPTYVGTIADEPSMHRRIGDRRGSGTHLDPSVAICRAVTEAAQTRLTYIAGSRDDLDPETYAKMVDEARAEEVFRLLSTVPPPRSFSDRRDLTTGTFEGDVTAIVAALQSVGVDNAIVVDLSREEFGIPVVRVVVPQLQPPQTDDLEELSARARARLHEG